MATSFVFNGKKIHLAGVYSAIKSGIKNPPLDLDYGKVLIIDTGSGAGYGFGSGVLGTLKSKADAVYSGITDQGSMKALMKGGLWWKLAEPLFKPDGAKSNGVSEVEFVRAAATTPATIPYSFSYGITNLQTLVTATITAATVGVAQVNTITVGSSVDEGDQYTVTLGTPVVYTAVFGDTPNTVAAGVKALIDASPAFSTVTSSIAGNVVTLTANVTNTPFTQTSSASNTTGAAGSLTIQVRDEGVIGNGVTANAGALLTQGYGSKFESGTVDTTKYIFKFYLGTYKGLDPINGVPYDNIIDTNTVPELVAQSPEVSKLSEAIAWMNTDSVFNTFFKLSASTAGQDDFTANDLITSGALIPASGGTETYSNAAFDAVLDIVTDHDFTFILSDKYAANAQHLLNTKVISWMADESKFDRLFIIGGGNSSSDFQTNSINAAIALNDDNVYVVHGGVYMARTGAPTGFDTFDSIFKAAEVLGRSAGIAPQVPPTFKTLGHSGEIHTLSKKEQEKALKYGVLYTIYDRDFKRFIIGQGINTLQNNDFQINDDGTSYSMQIKRIAAQLNREIVVNAKKQLFGDPNGTNQNTLSAQNVKDWLTGYLKRKVAIPTNDNLLIDYDANSITVERRQDAYWVTYKFQPNGEITKMFLTGFMIN